MRSPLSAVFAAVLLMGAVAVQPVWAGTMQVENLNRGLIAIRQGQGYYLSWRLLANEPYNTGFNVYRGTTRLNSTPITGATIYTDANTPVQTGTSTYTVRAVVNGTEQAASDPAIIIANTDGANAGYIHIDLQRPPNGAQGGNYSPGDGSTGDLTGNGVYDIVLKWDPSNAQDNANSGVTDNVLIDAYTLTGTRLWRINLGPNIRAGAHYTQFLVYDFDGCGKAEVMMKTAPGTRDGTGALLSMGPAATADHSAVYRNSSGYILTGPEYLTVFDGATGKELATVDYWPARGTVSSWGDNYGNRVDRFNAVVAYVDGERPTGVFQRGYYTRQTFAAWDWRDGRLTQRWRFDSGTSGNSAYAGQGNHSLSVADVDNSGRHSIITGSAVIKYDGTGFHTKGYGHGDALHVAHMIKNNPYPQIFMPHESGSIGVSLRHANNGDVLFTVNNSADVGRGAAAHLDSAVAGFQFWAAGGMGLYDINGRVISTTLPNNGNNEGVCNFVVWWSGQLSRELLNRNQITRWSVARNTGSRLFTATGAGSINGTKSTPILQADLFGDWREEVIWAYGNSALRIYTTTMPTRHRLVTLMHDPTYRVAVAWQNSSYNQPPHPGYYIASDMDFPPPPLNVAVVGGGTITPPLVLPTINITEPANNSMFMPGQSIRLAATASVSSGSIAQIEYSLGASPGAVQNELCMGITVAGASSNRVCNVTSQGGTYTITATATTGDGATRTSAPVNITVGRYIGSGDFVDSLVLFDLANVSAWSMNGNFAAGAKAYGDREHTVASIPAAMQGADWVSPAMDTRSRTAPDTLARFKMAKDGIVYIAHEDRVSPRPAWLAARGFTAITQNMTVNDITTTPATARPFTVYRRQFSQGDVVALGPNSSDGTTTSMMYMVAVADPVSTSISANNKAKIYTNSLNAARAGNSVRISYSVKDRSSVKLDLFDIKGNRVRTLVNTSKDAGAYNEYVSMDGLAAGMYVVRFNVGKQVLRDRVLIAK